MIPTIIMALNQAIINHDERLSIVEKHLADLRHTESRIVALEKRVTVIDGDMLAKSANKNMLGGKNAEGESDSGKTRQAKERVEQETACEQARQAPPFRVGDTVEHRTKRAVIRTVESVCRTRDGEWLLRAVGDPVWLFSCAEYEPTDLIEPAPFKPGDHVVGTKSGARYVVAETRKDAHWGWLFRALASPHWYLCSFCGLADRGVWTPWGFVPL